MARERAQREQQQKQASQSRPQLSSANASPLGERARSDSSPMLLSGSNASPLGERARSGSSSMPPGRSGTAAGAAASKASSMPMNSHDVAPLRAKAAGASKAASID